MFSKIDDYMSSGEEKIETIHPSRFDTRHIKGTIIYPGVMIIAITALLGVRMANMFNLGFNPAYITALYILPIGMMTFYEIRRRFVMYHFTDKQVVEETGIFNKTLNTLHYQNITHSSLDQDFEERIFGVSDIDMDSAGESTTELKLNGVRNAPKYKEIIDNHAFNNQNQNQGQNQQNNQNFGDNGNANQGNGNFGGDFNSDSNFDDDFDSNF